MTITLGLDIGTTRMKAVVYDAAAGMAMASVSLATPVVRDAAGDRRDPEAVWLSTVELCHRLAHEGAPLDRIDGVSVAAVGEEIVFLDEQGRSTGPVSCWYVDHSSDVDDVTAPPHALASWYAVRAAIRGEDPAVRSAVAFTDLGSSVLLRLAGARLPIMDRTHACRTGLLDADHGGWSSARLASSGIAHLRTPELVDSGARIGVVDAGAAEELGIPADIPVRAGAHDHLCAALAAGVSEPGDVLLSVGTSESQLMLVDASWPEVAALERPGLEVGYFVDGRLRYLHAARPSGRRVADLVAADPAGRGIAEMYAALSAIIDPTASDAPVLLQNAEGIDPSAAALFHELHRQATDAAELTSMLEQAAGRPAGRIRITGSPVQHEIWRRLRRSTAGRPVEFVGVEEPSAVGAGILAASAASRRPASRSAASRLEATR
ncbi:FGGY family carbohydrate kinase [Agromyces sp. Marseille-P2726]|uniref:FGGY family carbohydrate kinase n=1 Tax=Agromyces sp. Marseille-P2726 TaxID=2709132 RepID=UPI00156FEE19|nr:FGGY family carbohydrate kinase [Agromyces sp. Marseille-P2726]